MLLPPSHLFFFCSMRPPRAAAAAALYCCLCTLLLAASRGSMAAPSPINAPPAAYTLVLTGVTARIDRAADSAGAARLTLEGVPPAAASIPAASPAPGDARARTAPSIQSAGAALAAVPAGAPLVLIITTTDGAQRSLVARATGPPQWTPPSGAGGGGAVSLDAELVGDDGSLVSLARGAAGAYFGAPARLTPANLPGRLLASAAGAANGTAAGAALMIDMAIV